MKKFVLSFVAFIVAISLFSCVEDEMYKGPADITSVSFSPSAVTPDDPVIVTVTGTDLQGIVSASISYTVNGSSTANAAMSAASNNTFTGIIPQQQDKSTVVFTVSIVNEDGFTTTSKEYSYTVGAIPPDFTQLVLNEIDGNSKTIELYNAGTKTIPLEGVTLTKNNSTEWWRGSAAAGKIPAGGYILIVQDNTDPLFAGASGISTKQNLKFELKDPSGNSIGIFLRGDEGNLGGTISNVAPKSYQRIPNGTGAWKLADPTIGKANADSGADIPSN